MSENVESMQNLRAYDGSGDFIFVSYAHKDDAEVAPIVGYLQKRGYNVWFDGGIKPGKDWDEVLKKKVESCSCFLCFISEHSMSSSECRKEIVRARNANRPLISIFLENATIPQEIEEYILKVQGIEKWRMHPDSESAFYVKLLSNDLFDACKESVEFVIQDGTLVRYNGTASTVVIPDEVSQIGYDAFEGNAGIVEIKIHGHIDRIGKFAFNDMPNLRQIEVDPENAFFLSDDGVLYNKAHNYLLRYPPARMGSEYIVPKGVTNIGIGSFSGAADLKHIEIPDSVTMMGDRAFESCRELVGVNLEASIDKIRPYTFSRCSSLIGIELPSTLTTIGDGAFSGCGNLLGVNIPEHVSHLGEMAFAYCSSLESIRIPSKLNEVEEYCFNECRSLASIDLGQTRQIKQYAFKNCESLAQIALPSTLEHIGRAAFSGCQSIKRTQFPESVVSLGDYSFDRCASLEEVVCGTRLEEIGEGAFKDDAALKRIVIPRDVTCVGADAIPEEATIEYV